MTIKIQLVDDEPSILKSLQRLLKPFGWDIHAFDNPTEALEALLEHDYAVIVSDYKMPTMDGVTYLRFAKQRQPDAMRMILSAHGDRHSMIQAINQAEIYRFLSKPWEDYEIEAALRAAIDLSQLKAENRRLLQEVHVQQQRVRERESELLRLEREHPGITRVRRDEDGSVMIDEKL